MSLFSNYTPPQASLFRAYDVRGIVGETLHTSDFCAIGHAFATHLAIVQHVTHPRVVLLRDGRLSSPALADAMREGMLRAGAEVLDGGIGPTPLCYFATHHEAAHGSVMVTGSHNPPQHNGAKFMVGKASLYGDALAGLLQLISQGRLQHGKGSSRSISPTAAYVSRLREEVVGLKLHAISSIWDCGNGAAGEVVEQLLVGMAGLHRGQFTEIDGTFPNHHPDPSDAATLVQLQEAVRRQPAAIGFALDGDGDRLGVVDEKGRILAPDHVLMLLARSVLRDSPGAPVIADVKTSEQFFRDVRLHGGDPMLWKTGHALIKEKMREVQAMFAGEASGHLFFADRYYGFDDGLYAALRVLRLVAESGKSLAELVDTLPTLHASREFRIPCADAEKFNVVAQLAQQLEEEGARVNTLDGVRVSEKQGWWLLRASNTQAALVARCEGESAEAMEALVEKLRTRLEAMGLAMPT